VKIQVALDTEGKLVPQSDVELMAFKVQPPAAPAGPGTAK